MPTADLDALIIPVGLGSRRIDQNNDLRSDFGGNYSQRGSKGINSTRQVWGIVYDNLTTASLVRLLEFLRPLKSVTIFTWTPPRQSTALKWTVQKDSLGEVPKIGNAVSDVKTIFIQEFDI